MNESLNTVFNSVLSFVKEEDGAQVVEYALIIAVVSIGLVVALQLLGGGAFAGFIDRVDTCLTTAVCV
jgi:pilus assembly protein Flp/PilA